MGLKNFISPNLRDGNLIAPKNSGNGDVENYKNGSYEMADMDNTEDNVSYKDSIYPITRKNSGNVSLKNQGNVSV